MKNRILRLPGMSILALAVSLAGALTPAGSTYAQAPTQAPNSLQSGDYIDYPQNRGKVQEFHIQGFPSWLTLDMQLRGRTESQFGYQYTAHNNRIYELTRVFGGAAVRPTRWLTVYGQFIDTHALGLPIAHQASNMRDDFDLRQGYIEVHGEAAHIYVGRRELGFGNQRVLGVSDYSNNGRTWDGFFGHFGNNPGRNSLDVFSASVVTVYPESLDKHGAGLTYHGAYASIGAWLPKDILVQPFVLVKAEPRVKSQQGTYGTETQVTFGAESFGRLPGGFYYDVLGDLQRGSYSNDSIHAGADIERLYYTFTKVPWKPRLGGEYDYATGNPHTNPGRISTYDQQYPSTHDTFGTFDLFGFQNINEERVNLDLGPTNALTLLVQGEAIDISSRHDNIYNTSGGTAVAAPTQGFVANRIGEGFDISGKYLITENFTLNAVWSHFFPERLMTAAGKGAPLTYSMISLTYRFRVEK